MKARLNGRRKTRPEVTDTQQVWAPAGSAVVALQNASGCQANPGTRDKARPTRKRKKRRKDRQTLGQSPNAPNEKPDPVPTRHFPSSQRTAACMPLDSTQHRRARRRVTDASSARPPPHSRPRKQRMITVHVTATRFLIPGNSSLIVLRVVVLPRVLSSQDRVHVEAVPGPAQPRATVTKICRPSALLASSLPAANPSENATSAPRTRLPSVEDTVGRPASSV
jgi:hypothetical protein